MFLIFVGEAFANDPKVTSFSVSGVIGGERGCGQETFYLNFESPTRKIALQYQPDTCFALFKEKGMKFKTACYCNLKKPNIKKKNFSPDRL